MSITRRLFIGGSAAGMIAAPAAATDTQHPLERLHKLADQLPPLMRVWDEHMGSAWELRVQSDGSRLPLIYHNLQETPQARYDRARIEFIAATKELHPDVRDWRTVMDEDEPDGGNTVGLFMILGHRPKEPRA
jgi:hypothetical protein